MILQIPGGVYFHGRSDAWHHQLTLSDAGRVYLRLPADKSYVLHCEKGEPVRIGSPIASLEDGSFLYATVSGTFDGVFSLHDCLYAGVSDNTQRMAIPVMQPEERPLSDIPRDELLDSIRKLSILDTRRGTFLWKTVSAQPDGTRRILVDLTDDVSWSFTNYAFALQNADDILGGAKVLCSLLGAAKIILITDAARKKVKKVLTERTGTDPLFSVAEIGARYPVCDQTLMAAIYNQPAEAASAGMFFVSGQTCGALLRGLLTGFAHTEHILTAAGDGFEHPCVLQVPFGTTWKTILRFCGFKGSPFVTRINSPINGSPATGILRADQCSVFSSTEQKRPAAGCLSCGQCADACPAGLYPFQIIGAKNYKDVKMMSANCLQCGCCSYVCPSNIPLESMIGKYAAKEAEHHV